MCQFFSSLARRGGVHRAPYGGGVSLYNPGAKELLKWIEGFVRGGKYGIN